jgi:LAS superfamily LD-carboxypeptidase LdcB
MKRNIMIFLLIIVVTVSGTAVVMNYFAKDNGTDNIANEDELEEIPSIQEDGLGSTEGIVSEVDSVETVSGDKQTEATVGEVNETVNNINDDTVIGGDTQTDNTSQEDIAQNGGDNSQLESDDSSGQSFEALLDEHQYNFTDGITEILTNPESLYVLANKKNELPSDYVPEDLIVPDVLFTFEGDHEKKHLRETAAYALEDLFNGAKEDGLTLYAISGYRSYSLQESIYNYNVNTYGEAKANTFSAKPGQSEHQTGLAMDISCADVGYLLETEFGELPEGIWISEHAHEYGFIIRYLEDKTEITEYSYEPWHLRYVGVEIATYIYENHLCLEEFYEGLATN